MSNGSGPHGRGNRGNRGGRGRGGTPIDRTGVPRGVCSFYWSTGACNRSFDCTYKHEAKPQASSIYDATETEDPSPDFFSRDGLAMNNGSVMDSQHTLRPNEAHNYLKPYLADYFVFQSASNVEGFSRILASVNSRNKAWGNALLRIGDVLRFSPVAVNVGTGSSILSYQKGYFPIIEFLSSDLVLKTTMHKNTNMIYALLDRNYDDFHSTTRKCMREMIEARTWMDRSLGLPVSRQNTLCGVEVFGALSIVLSQYFARVKSAIKNHPELRDLVEDIFLWFNTWTAAVRASPPMFRDPITSSSPQIRNLTLGELEKDISRLSQIVGREYGDTEKMRRRVPNGRFTAGQRMEALTSRLEQAYDPPGTLRDGGPRHDNDFTDICNIRIAPTNEELLCPLPPYLPVFLPLAPHHLPKNSMERHLDIQFRLLREELVSSIRQSVGQIKSDLEIIWAPGTGLKTRKTLTLLEKLLSSKGGAYSTSGVNSVYFQLYTGACFAPLRAERRAFTVGLTLDSPPGAPRDKNGKKRAEYWEHSKRLQQGSLVALALISPGQFRVFLGTTATSGADIAEFAKTNEETIQLRVSFFDAEIELMALRRQPISLDKSTFAVLIDNQIMFEALHPFLRTLKDVEPTSIPFSALISYTGNLASMPVVPPRYARVPSFRYNLQCLARPGEHISSVDVNNPTSSFTGKEILRVLFASKIRPIVLIAFTNHALDNMLTSVLDANITEQFVRLGSRTTDARIEQHSLYKLEQLSGRGELSRPMGREYAAMKRVEEEMTHIMNRIQLPALTLKDTETFLDSHYPQHADFFRGPPFWIAELLRRAVEDEIMNGEWTQVSKGKKALQDAEISGVYGFWKYGRDIEFIQPPPSLSNRATGEERTDPDLRTAFFNEQGFEGRIPLVPVGSRSVQQLTGFFNVWSMSIRERQRLAESWEDEMREEAYDSFLSDFDRQRTQYKDACKAYEDIRDEARRRLLSRTDLIACTTTGAASLVSLLTSVGPKVLMVEEAGQVLEAHILASLVPSVEHLICIGDPKQLRPNLATFALSMDSTSGGELFKFDRSLMERLSEEGMSMSQINVQRRMRPSISHFVRTILYPNLEDNEVVRDYPAVHGMEKNVVFFSHNNPESSEDDSVSKHNMFEVAMIRDLVLYLLKQGPYDGAGDIAVLCAYLGQLQKVRAALKDLKIAVSVDERDEEQLERTGLAGDDDMGLAQIRIGTLDTFQGQEAKIVIISLVRNSGTFEEGNASIGFLKSSNRINVALSRAKHGLYILGNASNLRKSETWRTVLEEMEKEDQIYYGFPIVCPRHPQARRLISKPGQLPTHAPKGGCLRPCESRLLCGHVCSSIRLPGCEHRVTITCSGDPSNLEICGGRCPRAHPCPKLCSEDCGNCMSLMYNVRLPCGHVVESVPCHKLENLETIKCFVWVSKRLPGCEHRVNITCSGDPSNLVCKEICGGHTACCGRTCKSRCHECQEVTRHRAATRTRAIPPVRTHHRSHPCERTLKCQHLCGLVCSSDHSCNPKCAQSCRRQCGHQKCQKECWEPCSPCMEPCQWRCRHHSCPVICSRLPCDKACEWRLECGHRCPSICGEPCKQQTCIVCLPDERKVDIVDFVMQRRLDEIDLSSDDISERLIRLECGHIFTVGTLDGHCNMSKYYGSDAMGAFTTTKAPPVDFQTPPSCPTCRRPITALRYGRITKKANIDILERNVESTLSSTLEEAGSEIESFLRRLDNVKSKAQSIAVYSPSHAADFDTLSAHRRTRFGPESSPLSHDEISRASMTNVHGLSVQEGSAWNNVVHDLLTLYRKIVRVARTRGPYVQAYDAALATLYSLELSVIASDPERASDTPGHKIGQPPHKATFFLSFELRYTRIEGLNRFYSYEAIRLHERLWQSFVSFIYESCIHDAKKALKIAKKSSVSRLVAQAGLELFRFEILAQHTLQLRRGLLDDNRRNELSTEAHLEMKKLETRYLRTHRRAWFMQNCREKGDKIPLTVKAPGFCKFFDSMERIIIDGILLAAQHRRRFFGCVSGHAFAIGTCGDAIKIAHCPECNAITFGWVVSEILVSRSRHGNSDCLCTKSTLHYLLNCFLFYYSQLLTKSNTL
ncbi:hypothetical protein EDB87DRAFT_1676964 [Lactarius vividus]|nr:hypothetical protein EDB87DRAFT_1676964 [Lactarius vividus]